MNGDLTTYKIIRKDDYLSHYGIKGMKWGVRRYQNKDGSLTPKGIKRYQYDLNKQSNKIKGRDRLLQDRTIPAGVKMYKTTSKYDETLDGSTYVTYLDVDRNHYKGGHIRMRDRSPVSYEHEYTLRKDLNIPSREKQQQIINDVVRSNKKYLNESVTAWVDEVKPKNSWSRMTIEEDYDGGVKKFVKDTIKEWGNNTPEELSFSVCQSFGLAPNVKKAVISELSKQGYNAMVDEASVGGQNNWLREGYDPLIIFDSSILSTNSVKQISKREEKRARNKFSEWQWKANLSDNKSAMWSDMSNEYLSHHGVKGMKWGVRRYQNKDGSRTTAGKKRYGGYISPTGKESDIKSIQSTFSKKERKMMGLDYDTDTGEKVIARFINKIGDTPVAYLQLTDVGKHMNASVGTRKGDDYRGKGYASECVKAGLDWYVKNANKFDNKPIVWWAKKENIASQRTAEKSGLKRDRSIEKSDDEWLKNNWVKYVYN